MAELFQEMMTPPASYGSARAAETPAASCITFKDGGGSTPGSACWTSGERFEIRRDRILRELQQMVNRYDECFLCLQDAIADVELLRQENLQLSAENLELVFLVNEMESTAVTAVHGTGKKKAEADLAPSGKGKAAAIGSLPKSISIRSPGFLTVKHPTPGGTQSTGDGSSDEARPHRLRLPTSTALQGGEDGDSPGPGPGSVEVDVYEQGMVKTELCNKWGEKGHCPYGERCRFAHGIQELRPVIRHPRYKTQLCRMVGGCPYGHRCHFRHAALPK